MFSSSTNLTPVELQSAIIRNPLVIAPDTTVAEAIAQMNSARSHCSIDQSQEGKQQDFDKEARSSCVIVVEDRQVIGILTERDIIRFLSQEQSLDRLVIHQVMAHPVVTMHEEDFTDLFVAINLLKLHHVRHLPLVDQQNHLVGLITHESLRQTSRPADLLRLRLVQEVMTAEVICTAPHSSLLAIAQTMADRRISSVVIVESRPSPTATFSIPIGMITERDLVQFQSLDLNLGQFNAEAVMSQPIFTVKPEDSLWTVQQMMEQYSIRRIAVTGQQEELLGIVTQTSLLQALNPLELYNLAKMLEKKAIRLEVEKVALLENRNEVLKQQADREKLLTKLATQIRSSLNLQTILETTVEQVRQALECDRVNIWQLDSQGDGIVVAESTLLPLSAIGERIDKTWFEPSSNSLGVLQGRICAIADIDNTEMSDVQRERMIRLGMMSKLLVPILCDDRLWGLLNVCQSDRPRSWEEEEIELVQALSVQLAIAVQQATVHTRLQEELIARQQVETCLLESEQRYSSLVAAAPVGIFRSDPLGNYIYVNDRYCQITELTPETAIGQGWQQGLHPEDSDYVIRTWQQCVEHHQGTQMEYRLQCPQGQVKWVYGQWVIECDREGQLIGYVGTITDISNCKETEVALRESQQFIQTVLDTFPLSVFWKNKDSVFLGCNQQLAQRLNLRSTTEIIGKTDFDFLFTENQAIANRNQDRQVMESEQAQLGIEGTLTLPSGELRWIETNKLPLRNLQGNIVGVVGTFQDITDRKQAEENLQIANQKLEELAETDGLTQVANRRHFDQRLHEEWQQLQQEQQCLSLILFDVDYFKRYNDYYGHLYGDECLVKLAQASQRATREATDLVARYGGEEFVVLLPNTDAERSIYITQRIQSEIRTLAIEHQTSDISPFVTISAGIASIIPSTEDSPEILIARADKALYRAKGKGRNCYCLYV